MPRKSIDYARPSQVHGTLSVEAKEERARDRQYNNAALLLQRQEAARAIQEETISLAPSLEEAESMIPRPIRNWRQSNCHTWRPLKLCYGKGTKFKNIGRWYRTVSQFIYMMLL